MRINSQREAALELGREVMSSVTLLFPGELEGLSRLSRSVAVGGIVVLGMLQVCTESDLNKASLVEGMGMAIGGALRTNNPDVIAAVRAALIKGLDDGLRDGRVGR